MKHRILPLLLTLVLLIGLLAGCQGSTETAASANTTEAASSAETAAQEGETETAQDAPAAAPAQTQAAAEAQADTAAVSGSSAGEAASENDVGPVITEDSHITYPIGDGSQRVTLWTSLSGRLTEYLPSQNDLRVLPLVLEATGATYQFEEVSESAATEQFQLMIASGDWTDLLCVTDLYTGGMAQAYEDSIILDLTDEIQENMPDYWAFVESLNKTSRETMSIEGMELGIWTIADTAFSDRGFAVRSDWLDALGLEVPTTITAFTDSLYAMYDAYAPASTVYMGGDGILSYVAPAFDTTLPGASAGSTLYLYRDGDTVCTGYTSDGYRAYLEWFYQLYQDGVINQEFYNTSSNEGDLYGDLGAGRIGYFSTDAERMVLVGSYLDENNQDLTVTPVATILGDDDTGNQWVEEVSYVNSAYSVTGCCQDTAFTLQFLNFFFTEPGWLLSNYGEEGFSWEYDENGNPRYNDQVLNNPDGIPTGACSQIYCLNIGPYYMSMRKMQVTWNDEQIAAVDVWTDVGTDEHGYPEGASLTTSESSGIVNYMNDCISYGTEAILKFMTGAEPITDETWSAYLAGMDGCGLQDCLDVYQSAYDDYQSGNR